MSAPEQPMKSTTPNYVEPVPPSDSSDSHGPQAFWLWILCLIGLDYFSTLAYQPSIAFSAAGRLAPIATIFLVILTLFGAYPVYCYIAEKSSSGLGSLAMLQKLVKGWTGKFLVLVVLGFAATGFVLTITLSTADAAAHLIHNPVWNYLPDFMHHQLMMTLVMITVLGAVFMKGVREVIGVAVTLVTIFISLNVLLIGTGLYQLATHPDYLMNWWREVQVGNLAIEGVDDHHRSWIHLIFLSLFFFPKLILGLSGFETTVAVMPLVKGDTSDHPEHPAGRIRNTKKMLLTAALIMSCLLLGSSLVVTTLIPAGELAEGGKAINRALAYLAHGEGPHQIAPWTGEIFGTIYDLSTVAILWFAGASALSGLLSLIPRFLPHYGMAPSWATAVKPLVLIITCVCYGVTLAFNANVNEQGAPYATGVMVLILSGCIAVTIEKSRSRTTKNWANYPWYPMLVGVFFAYATFAIIWEKPDGLMIALMFVSGILVVSIISRIVRSTELRVVRFDFADHESQFLWNSLQHLEVPVLAPHRPGARSLEVKEKELRDWHHIPEETPVVFIEVQLGDPSDFYQSPRLRIQPENGIFLIRVDRCTATAPALAAIALALSKPDRPVELHFGWSDESPMRTNLGFLLFGEGNVPWLVRDLIVRAEPDDSRRPRIIIG